MDGFTSLTEIDTPRRQPKATKSLPKLQLAYPCNWSGETVAPREWIVPGLIPCGTVTQLSGDGGLGKSLLTLQLMAATAAGRSWLGIETLCCRSVGIFCEDEEDELKRRMFDIEAAERIPLAEIDGIGLLSRVGEENSLMEFSPAGVGKPTPLWQQLVGAVVGHGARLVILDSLHDLFTGNENSRTQARQFIGLLRGLALKVNGAVVLNAHPSLAGLTSGTGSAGSTAWHNAVRSRLYLTRPESEGLEPDPDARVLSTKKANYGAGGQQIQMRWQAGAFVIDRPASPFARSARQQAADEAFLACLDLAHAQRRLPSAAKQSPNFVGKLFPALAAAQGFRGRDFEAAMQRLLASGEIEIGTRLGPDRHPRPCIIRANSPVREVAGGLG